MVADGVARLDRRHDFPKGPGRRVDIRRDLHSSKPWCIQEHLQLVGREEALVDDQFGALCVLDKPLVGIRIPAEYEAAVFPVETEADRAVENVDSGEGRDLHTVFLVDDTFIPKVELVGDDLASGDGKGGSSALDVPGPRFLLVFYEGLGAQSRFGPTRTVDVQRRVAAVHPAADVQFGEATDVIGV